MSDLDKARGDLGVFFGGMNERRLRMVLGVEDLVMVGVKAAR